MNRFSMKLISELKLENSGTNLQIIEFNEKNSIVLIIIADEEGFLNFYSLNEKFELKKLHKFQLECKSEIWQMKYLKINKNEYLIYIGSAAGGIYAYKIKFDFKLNENDSQLINGIELTWKQKANDMITKMEIKDLNNDEQLRLIVTSLDNTIRVLNPYNGDLIWGQIFQSGVTTFTITESLNYLKLNQNDICRKFIIASSIDGSLRVFRGDNGELINFIQLPNNIREILIYKTILICACDDFNVYFIKFEPNNKLNIIYKIFFNAYPWILKINNNKLIIFTYSFNFMEGIIEKISDQIPSIKIIELNKLLYKNMNFECILTNIEKINAQTVLSIEDIKYFNKINLEDNNNEKLFETLSKYLIVATTEKKIYLLNIETSQLLDISTSDGIINDMNLIFFTKKFYLIYIDDEKFFKIIEL